MSRNVGIIGAGMSGLCMAVKLKQAGYDTFTIYEKAGEVGGTWRENTYPGLSCDVPARFYSYSFAPNPEWSRNFAPGGEIQRYFTRVADDLGLREHIRFGSEVVSADWTGTRWRLRFADGNEDEVDVLASATGVLHHPTLPDIPGLDSFAGPSFHSARWDHSVPLRGRRVAVLGTGSTGVQITTALAGVAGRLSVFQRTAQWILPIPRLRYSAASRALLRRFPILNRLSYRGHQLLWEAVIAKAVIAPGWQRRVMSALCRLNLRLGVRDPGLRRTLTPPDQPMCKRLIMSAEYYPTVQRPDVDVITARIERIEPRGVVTGDGRLHEVDVLVLATGFDAHAYLRSIRLTGENGVTLDEAWSSGPHAYRTVALPGFPNFFMLMGPHSPIGNHSLIAIAETQADYVVRWLDRLAEGGSVAPTEHATAEFNAQLRDAMPDTVWTTGCRSWYLGPDGQPELWPWTPGRHRAMLAEPEPRHFTNQTA